MSLSHHSDEYHEMVDKMEKLLRNYINDPHLPDHYYSLLMDGLLSIMNDYGAVAWT